MVYHLVPGINTFFNTFHFTVTDLLISRQRNFSKLLPDRIFKIPLFYVGGHLAQNAIDHVGTTSPWLLLLKHLSLDNTKAQPVASTTPFSPPH